MPYGDYYFDYAAASNRAQRSYDAKIQEGQAEFQRNVDRRDFDIMISNMRAEREKNREDDSPKSEVLKTNGPKNGELLKVFEFIGAIENRWPELRAEAESACIAILHSDNDLEKVVAHEIKRLLVLVRENKRREIAGKKAALVRACATTPLTLPIGEYPPARG